MNKDNPTLLRLKTNLKDALGLLQSDSEITADLYRETVEDLEMVRTLTTKETVGEGQVNMNFEELVRDFNTS